MEIFKVPKREAIEGCTKRLISHEKAEYEEIREILEKEFGRRIGTLKKTLAELGIAEDAVILAPPVLNRTDFGYVSDIDLVFLGNEEQEMSLYEKLQDDFGIYPFVVRYDPVELEKMREELPEFYSFLMERRGNIKAVNVAASPPSEEFLDRATDLEAKARTLQSEEEKLALKKERLTIGERFVEDVGKQVAVLGYCFSGSMMNDMDRFSSISDLDIEMLTKYEDEKNEEKAFKWIHMYLKWKYAEKFGIKVDVGDTSLKSAKKFASLDPVMRKHFEHRFGVDVINV